MLKLSLLLLSLTLIQSCNSKQEASLPAKIVETQAVTPAATNKDCEALEFSTPEPLANWKMDAGKELVVCNYNGGQKINDSEFEGWINIFEKGTLATPLIAEVESELPSEFYSFRVKKIDGTKVTIQRLVQSSVATEANLECGKEGCKLSPEKCINHTAYKVDQEAVQNLLAIRFKKKPATDFGDLDALIGKVVHAALAGDKQAQLALYGDGNEKNELATDGAAAETLMDGMQLIEIFSKLGCIKK